MTNYEGVTIGKVYRLTSGRWASEFANTEIEQVFIPTSVQGNWIHGRVAALTLGDALKPMQWGLQRGHWSHAKIHRDESTRLALVDNHGAFDDVLAKVAAEVQA